MTSDSPVTFVTGGATGIGAAVTRRLLEKGHQVAILGRSRDRLDRFADGLGKPERLRTFAGDTSDYEMLRSAVDAVVKEFGRLDVAVANAGFVTHDSILTGDPDGWRDMVLTNVLGPALLIRATAEALKAAGGRVVLVGSVAGHVYTKGNLYGATKWAVTGLAENSRQALTPEGVGVTLVSPGRVETPFWDGGGGVPDGPILTPDQIADSIVWAVDQPAGVDVNTVVIRPVGAAI